MGPIFHRLIREDLRSILSYYREKGGPELANRFYDEFERLVEELARNPRRFHIISDTLRRANFQRFPFHLLYREIPGGVRVLVLKHHHKDPRYGRGRR